MGGFELLWAAVPGSDRDILLRMLTFDFLRQVAQCKNLPPLHQNHWISGHPDSIRLSMLSGCVCGLQKGHSSHQKMTHLKSNPSTTAEVGKGRGSDRRYSDTRIRCGSLYEVLWSLFCLA